MSYCTTQDLIARFGSDEMIEISDHANEGNINNQVLQQAVDDASSEIDGYLAGRYQLPLANPPRILNKFACDIARYNLYDEGASEAVDRRYNDAVKFLRSASKGEVSLGVIQGTEVQGAAHSQVVSDGHVFSRKNKSFI